MGKTLIACIIALLNATPTMAQVVNLSCRSSTLTRNLFFKDGTSKTLRDGLSLTETVSVDYQKQTFFGLGILNHHPFQYANGTDTISVTPEFFPLASGTVQYFVSMDRLTGEAVGTEITYSRPNCNPPDEFLCRVQVAIYYFSCQLAE
jgi:hypothetical protein